MDSRILIRLAGGSEDALEDCEDILLSIRAEKAEDKWKKAGMPTITHEELWKRLT